jgi:transcriptional regulator with XRE-family HTH domain
MSEPMSKFSDWLLKQMEEKDWSQADLARAADLTRSTISYYLSPKSKSPDEAALRKLAHAFKLPPEFVFEKAGLLPPKPELSVAKQRLLHVAESEELLDSDIDLVVTLLEQRIELYRKNPKARPAQ